MWERKGEKERERKRERESEKESDGRRRKGRAIEWIDHEDGRLTPPISIAADKRKGRNQMSALRETQALDNIYIYLYINISKGVAKGEEVLSTIREREWKGVVG